MIRRSSLTEAERARERTLVGEPVIRFAHATRRAMGDAVRVTEQFGQHVRTALLAVGGVAAVLWLADLLPSSTHASLAVSYWARTMHGAGGPSDLGQDLIGARALLDEANAYPLIGPAMVDQFGVSWDVHSRSTHPPTAFLFVLPLAGMSWAAASAAWAVLTAALFGVCVRLLDLGWAASVVAVVAFALWPASAASFGQFSALWLLCALLAWRWRERPRRAGAVIAVAALTKLFPALMLLMFIRRRQWSAVWSFAAVCTAAVLVVTLLSVDAVVEYTSIILRGADEQVARTDNGALLIFARHLFGGPGLLAGIAIIAAAGITACRSQDPHVEWLALLWLSVALMPVGWIYTVCVLAPIPVASLRIRPHFAAPSVLAGVGLFFVDPFGTEATAAAVAAFIAVTGVGVVTLASPSKRLAVLRGTK